MGWWIRFGQEITHDPRTRKLARRLGEPLRGAVGLLACLWAWAVEYAANGTLTNFDDEDIAIAAEWDGDSTVLVRALVECGWLNEERALVGWDQIGGKLIERRRADAERKRRDRGRGDVPRTSDAGQGDVRRWSGGRPLQRNVTRRDERNVNPLSPVGDVSGEERSKDTHPFDAFWVAYPRHHKTRKPGGGASKHQTRVKWEKLSEDERAACMVAVEHYAAAHNGDGSPYPKAALTWVNQRCWEDWQEPASDDRARRAGNWTPEERGET